MLRVRLVPLIVSYQGRKSIWCIEWVIRVLNFYFHSAVDIFEFRY